MQPNLYGFCTDKLTSIILHVKFLLRRKNKNFTEAKYEGGMPEVM